MADDIIVEQPTLEQQQAETKAFVDEQMSISLSDGIPPQQVINEPPVDQPPVDNPPPDFNSLKEKYSWQTPEDAVKEIEELRILKSNPPVSAIKYENEQSEKLAKAWQAGKMDEVYNFLDEQRKLDKLTSIEVNKDTAGEIIKTGLALKHKDLTQEEINYKYNKQFAVPKEPTQSDMETDEEFADRKSSWKDQVQDIEMSKIIEAKLLKPELEGFKSKLSIPEIVSQENADYIQWQKLMEDQQKLDAIISSEYQNLKPEDIKTKLAFIDEPNKINFEMEYQPTVEELKKVAEYGTDINKFLNSYVSDGKFDKVRFARDINFATNHEKILTEAMKQSKNATLKSLLPDNSQSGLQRQFPLTHEPSELEKEMQRSTAPFIRQGR